MDMKGRRSKSGKEFLAFILTMTVLLTTLKFPVKAETQQLVEALGLSESSVSENSVSENSVSENNISGNGLAENSVSLFSQGEGSRAYGLDNSVLENHIIPGLNPEQAVVNLFDYWQIESDHSWENTKGVYNSGISRHHLLIFGQPEGFGDWNGYYSGRGAYKGIVQNKLGDDGFPKLNLNFEDPSMYGKFTRNRDDNDGHKEEYPDGFPYNGENEESLAYLFSTTKTDAFKEIHADVRGLFQVNADGYYYYDSEKNFAELDAESSSFILYDSPGVGTSSPNPVNGNYGEFFPFNKGAEVFNTEYGTKDEEHPHFLSYVDENDPKVVEYGGASFIHSQNNILNHYLGFTLEVPFLQPENGLLNGEKEMKFNFSGDDDVWIFIDNILVADLGGIHGKRSLSINFTTGNVVVEGDKDADGNIVNEDRHTLLGSFEDAYGIGSDLGGVMFDGNTFADNTVHSLKMFYLERGHNASNLSLDFNIQIARYNQLKKVDQNGGALDNTAFALYPAKAYADSGEGRIPCTSTVSGKPCYVGQDGGEALLTFETGADGKSDFIDQATNSGYSFGRSPTNYYILRETKTPEGYRRQPVDIVLEYNSATAMLSVANRWESGAYASFTSYVNEWAGRAMSYGQYNGDTGFVESSDQAVSTGSRKKGLVLAVPMLLRKGSNVWLPLYGNNLDGFHTAGAPENSAESMRRALLKAALNQCMYEEGWFLEWFEEKAGLEGILSDLPGRADRYRHVNPDGDMRMVYIIIEPGALEAAGITGEGSADRYGSLKRYVKQRVAAEGETAIENVADELYGSPGADAGPGQRNVSMLDTAQFMRVFRSLIYISNEQRELRVQKVDKNGKPLNGARFGIYETMEAAQQGREADALTIGTTATVGDEEGMLVFKPQPDGTEGYAQFVWAAAPNTTYYLRETTAPEGYEVNETVIPIVIGIYSIYADAGTKDDGVAVMAGVGQLHRTMAKYASDGDVNITLRDITATAMGQASGSFDLRGWNAVNPSDKINLHYGSNTRMGMDYGRHNTEAGLSPFFTTETGFLRVNVAQNTDALRTAVYDEANNIANWDNLSGGDLTGLFSLLNVVVVEDWKAPDEQRELRVLKVDEDGTPLNGARFGLYKSIADAQAGQNVIASGVTAKVDGMEGVLVFKAQSDSRDGYARVNWTSAEGQFYYLKEVSAPEGYKVNETIIPVYIDRNSVYADAGIEEDGVSVMAGVGQLNREKTKYADESEASLTLRDITVAAQGQESTGFQTDKWNDLMTSDGESQKKNLHYDKNTEMGMDYGIHDIDKVNNGNDFEGETSFFIIDTGFICTRVEQNTEELRTGKYDGQVDADKWDDLSGQDITEWFSQLNVVVVENQKTEDSDDPDDPKDPEDPKDSEEHGNSEQTKELQNPEVDIKKTFIQGMNQDSDTDVEISSIGRDTPQTGDNSRIWMWAVLGIVSLSGISTVVCKQILAKRKQKKL